MFNWLQRWRLNRHRAIFQLWDGRRYRYVDPDVVFRCLKNHETFDLDTDTSLHDAGVEESTERCLLATREAFGVKEFDGSTGKPEGLTEQETLNLLGRFGDWMSAVKKNISAQRISSGLSEKQPPCEPEPSTEAGSSIADSPTISAESNCVAPTL